MHLQTARYLMKAARQVLNRQPVEGNCKYLQNYKLNAESEPLRFLCLFLSATYLWCPFLFLQLALKFEEKRMSLTLNISLKLLNIVLV